MPADKDNSTVTIENYIKKMKSILDDALYF